MNMPLYSGVFQYFDEKGTKIQDGSCEVSIDPPAISVIPQSGKTLSMDLGDIDVLHPDDYQISLELYTGKRLILSKFAKTYQNFLADLVKAYRDRLMDCLLLEDLEEIGRFDGHVDVEMQEVSFSSPAELRLFKSNLAILPQKGGGLQKRLADIDKMEFNDADYKLTLHSGNSKIVVGKLARRTSEFTEKLQTALDHLSENTAVAIRSLCPFLTPDQVMEVSSLMREGRAAMLSKLHFIDFRIEESLMANAVDPAFKPYFDALRQKAAGKDWFAGFKFIRPEAKSEQGTSSFEGDPSAGESDTHAPTDDGDEAGGKNDPVLYWFFIPLSAGPAEGKPNVLAWESTSRLGRATYFFKMLSDQSCQSPCDDAVNLLEAAVGQVNEALVMLNFRREPIYLPDASLQTEPRYRRYAIACRKMDVLRKLRASYLGRAIHTSVDVWQKQVDTILEKV